MSGHDHSTPDMTAQNMNSMPSPGSSMMDTEHGGCRASNMLWNWDTIDTCLISEQWHIRSTGMFAGACIAVVMLTLSLEFFRRLAKEYDRKITREHQEGLAAVMASATNSTTGSPVRDDKGARERRSQALDGLGVRIGEIKDGEVKERFRPSLGQQLIRGLLHTIQFTVAYFIMLLAMYYNGYILFCIFLGAYLGFVAFEWEWIEFSAPEKKQEEATSCCG